MSTVPNAPIWGVVVSIAGPLIRISRDRFAPPQKGMRYADLEIRPDDQLADKVASPVSVANPASKSRRQAYTHFIEISNYGREAILADDYIRPFCVTYQDGAEIIGYRVIKDDRAIQPTIHTSSTGAPAIEVREILNPGDNFTLGVLLALTEPPRRPTIDCRVKGISRIRGHLRDDDLPAVLWNLAVHYFAIPFFAISGLVIGYFIYLALNKGNAPIVDAMTFLVHGFGAGLVAGFLIALALVVIVEVGQYLVYRYERRLAEQAFRAAVQARLDKLVSYAQPNPVSAKE